MSLHTSTDCSYFWLVWNPMRDAPTHRHTSEESACREAERLARLNKGQRFYVLQANDCFISDDVRRIRLEDPDMPF